MPEREPTTSMIRQAGREEGATDDEKRKRPQGAASRVGGRSGSSGATAKRKCWRRHPMCPRSHRATAPSCSASPYSWPQLLRRLPATFFVEGRISLVGILAALVAALAASSSLHVALGWEKVVVLRLGKLNRVVGPGFYATIPILEHGTIRVDQRIIATPFRAERTLTADLVPVNIDAVLFWVVWDAEKACVEVEDYYAAISYLAQTSLREAVGRSTVAEVALRARTSWTRRSRPTSRKEAAGWGVDIISVKVRDIVIPAELQHVMSLEAQADRERNARMTRGERRGRSGGDARRGWPSVYGDADAALKLRTMLMQYETVRGLGQRGGHGAHGGERWFCGGGLETGRGALIGYERR